MPYIGKSPQFGVRSRFYYTQSSAGGTSVSGTDDNGKTLKFSDGEFVDVMLNGVTLVAGTDYNTSTTNTIAGLAALSNGDVIEVVVYDTFSVADTVSAKDGGTFSGNVAMGGTLAVTGQTTFSGDVVGAVQEYFHVDLTTTMTGLADVSTNTVDFGGKGTVKYDTKSNFDSTNDAYLLGSSDGVYLISYSMGIRSEDMSAEALIDGIAAIFVATDGTTFAPLNGGGSRGYDQQGDEAGSMMFSGSFIYKSTTSTTKIILKAYANTNPDTYQISNDVVTNQGHTSTTTSFVGARCTFLSVARIA